MFFALVIFRPERLQLILSGEVELWRIGALFLILVGGSLIFGALYDWDERRKAKKR